MRGPNRNPKPVCTACGAPAVARGLCNRHYVQGRACSYEGCGRAVRALGLCEPHYRRRRRAGKTGAHNALRQRAMMAAAEKAWVSEATEPEADESSCGSPVYKELDFSEAGHDSGDDAAGPEECHRLSPSPPHPAWGLWSLPIH